MWTDHAAMRVRERDLSEREVEQAIERGHSKRSINRGRAQWRVVHLVDALDGLVVVYDHPYDHDSAAVRIVSAWPL